MQRLRLLAAFVALNLISVGAAQTLSPVAPKEADIERILQAAYQKFKDAPGGKNADYIPQLAKVPSNLFGIAIVTTTGRTFSVGDTDYKFAIESVSKAFTLGLVMKQSGPAAVLEKIGAEPTGRPFNSVPAVEDLPGHIGNPLVNAGAMATVSLVSASSKDDRWQQLQKWFNALSNSKLTVLEEIYKSERDTYQHNQGIAYLLKSYDRFYSDVADAVDIYTMQCSLGVTAKELAMMGAVYANGGVQPVTKTRLLNNELIPHILATMMMAGLYDYAGTWAFKVGLPAKSGVGGGIVAVIPGKGAIVAFAPPLDKAGNSVKAQLAIEYVAREFSLNLFSPRSIGHIEN
jgi:glutaminase